MISSTNSPRSFEWPDHLSKAIGEDFGKESGGKFVSPLPSSKEAKNRRRHLVSKSDSTHSTVAFPKTTFKVGQNEAPAGFLQDLPEEDLVTVLEALTTGLPLGTGTS